MDVANQIVGKYQIPYQVVGVVRIENKAMLNEDFQMENIAHTYLLMTPGSVSLFLVYPPHENV